MRMEIGGNRLKGKGKHVLMIALIISIMMGGCSSNRQQAVLGEKGENSVSSSQKSAESDEKNESKPKEGNVAVETKKETPPPAVPVEVKPTVFKLGDKGEEVMKIQQRLVAYGYPVKPDGDFGRGTHNAIVDFQRRLGLGVDGVVGETTMNQLMKAPTEKTKYVKPAVANYDKFASNVAAFMNENDMASSTDYFIVTSLSNKKTYVFKGGNHNWKLMNTFNCTIGAPSTPTIKGRYEVGDKGYCFGMEKGYMCKYYTRISGDYLYHSVLYDTTGSRIIDGRLGIAASHGCIRLSTEAAKFIYDTIPAGTEILIK